MMKILIVGSSGFIGSYIYINLNKRGHQVSGCSRSIHNTFSADFDCDMNMDISEWLERLENFELVINCVGIYQNGCGQQNSFAQVHHKGPQTLFQACEQKKIKVIQISAIGAEQKSPLNEFLNSKKQADDYLLNSSVECKIFYPGVVLGKGGKSTQTLTRIAQLPIIPLLFPKTYHIPIISIQDLLTRIIAAIDNWSNTETQQCLYQKVNICEFFTHCRQYSGSSAPHFINFPRAITESIFTLFPNLQIGQINHQSLQLLDKFNHPQTVHVHKSHESSFNQLFSYLDKNYLMLIKHRTIKVWFMSILSLIWCCSGLVSLYNHSESMSLMASLNFFGFEAVFLIFAGAILDLFLGISMWWKTLRRQTLYAQIATIITYSWIVALYLPEHWLHPFAPMIKNLSVLMLIFYLLLFETSLSSESC